MKHTHALDRDFYDYSASSQSTVLKPFFFGDTELLA